MKYSFTRHGVNAMYNDSLDMIFKALMGDNENLNMDDLDIKVSIGNLQITIPNDASVFEELDIFLHNALEAYEE